VVDERNLDFKQQKERWSRVIFSTNFWKMY